MSSLATPHPPPMRRSQRRKNKLMANKPADYSIPNPYRLSSQQSLPDAIHRKVSRLAELSFRSLREITFQDTF